jgi:DNA repair protein RadC
MRRGAPILNYPDLLKRFLQARMARQKRAGFFAFYMDRCGLLIQAAKLFRGTSNVVKVYPKEVVRAALAAEAETVLCVRTDPSGYSKPTDLDVANGRWLRKTLEVMQTPLMNYLIVGKTMTSLAKKGHFWPQRMEVASLPELG